MDEEQLELIPEDPEPEPEQEQETEPMAEPTIKTGSMGNSADNARTKTVEEEQPRSHTVSRIGAFRIEETNTQSLEERRAAAREERR